MSHHIAGLESRAGEPLYFEDVAVGDRWKSLGRTVTETDVVNFAGMTGDYNPLHVDHEHTKNTAFGRPIAHGLLGLSMMAGLGSNSPLMQTEAFLRLQEWNFLKPIYIGDTIYVETEIVSKELSSRRRGLITWRRKIRNQRGEVVQEGTYDTLVLTLLGRPPQPR